MNDFHKVVLTAMYHIFWQKIYMYNIKEHQSSNFAWGRYKSRHARLHVMYLSLNF